MPGAQDKDRIIELLGTGLTPGVVANAVGCEPAYITQLMSQEEFASQVIERRSKSLLAATDRDRRLDSIEDLLIDKFKEQVETYQITKPRDILMALTHINRATRRGNPADASLTINQQVVQLTLPVTVVKSFTTNTHGEVIEVEGKAMQTMPAQSLLRHLASSKGEVDGEVYKKISRFIAPAIEHAISES